ncbi:MAG: C40 family peptidase [Weeksellaceae bacterium]|nr:C40 family peptidase [Weeksellaceae bacterium]
MVKAVCNVSVAPIRAEQSHQSEMVSQLLYGESAEILESNGNFTRIRMDFDGYEGWADSRQLAEISDEVFSERRTQVLTKTFGFDDLKDGKLLLSLGSELKSDINPVFETATGINIANAAKLFLNVPYLWSGRSFFGIDCSGLVQLVFKVHGITLPRDAYQQAEKGRVLDFVEESQPGDLAFFDDEEGRITHVGIMLDDQRIIHAYGKVRIDTLDSSGIFNADLKRHTHKLRFVKSIL